MYIILQQCSFHYSLAIICKILSSICWSGFEDLRHLMVFQWYQDLEDLISEIVAVRLGLEPQTPCSASQGKTTTPLLLSI